MPRWLCLLPLALGTAAYVIFGHPELPIIQFELAGEAGRAAEFVDGRESEFRDALVVDWVAFLPGYVLTICFAATRLGRHGWRRLMWFVIVAAVLAGLADAVENWFLWVGLDHANDGDFAAARAFAIVKFTLLVPAALIALFAAIRSVPTAAESAGEDRPQMSTTE